MAPRAPAGAAAEAAGAAACIVVEAAGAAVCPVVVVVAAGAVVVVVAGAVVVEAAGAAACCSMGFWLFTYQTPPMMMIATTIRIERMRLFKMALQSLRDKGRAAARISSVAPGRRDRRPTRCWLGTSSGGPISDCRKPPSAAPAPRCGLDGGR